MTAAEKVATVGDAWRGGLIDDDTTVSVLTDELGVTRIQAVQALVEWAREAGVDTPPTTAIPREDF